MEYDPTSARILLGRMPAVLRALLQGLPEAWLNASEGLGTWSVRDVACHLADLEDDGWLPRVRTILRHGTERPLPGIDRERFRERFSGGPLDAVLDAFQAAREANLRTLDELDLDVSVLDAPGRHPVLGEIRLRQLLSTWVVHDLAHVTQIARTLAAQYREEVGPWIEFLSILRPREPNEAT